MQLDLNPGSEGSRKGGGGEGEKSGRGGRPKYSIGEAHHRSQKNNQHALLPSQNRAERHFLLHRLEKDGRPERKGGFGLVSHWTANDSAIRGQLLLFNFDLQRMKVGRGRSLVGEEGRCAKGGRPNVRRRRLGPDTRGKLSGRQLIFAAKEGKKNTNILGWEGYIPTDRRGRGGMGSQKNTKKEKTKTSGKRARIKGSWRKSIGEKNAKKREGDKRSRELGELMIWEKARRGSGGGYS